MTGEVDQKTAIIVAKKIMKSSMVANIFICKLLVILLDTKIELHTTENIGFIRCDVSGFADKITFKVVLTSSIFIRVHALCSM